MRLVDSLSELSSALWGTYTGSADDDESAKAERDASDQVEDALRSPNLPSGGGVLQSYMRVLESAHSVGRVLHRIGDPALTESVVADVREDAAIMAEFERQVREEAFAKAHRLTE
jgi:hypothetical protein